MATAKNTRNTSNRINKQDKEAQRRAFLIRRYIKLIILFSLCLILFLCNFPIMGGLGDVLRGVMFGLFGMLSTVLPFAIIIGVIYKIGHEKDKTMPAIMVSGSVIVYIVGILLHMWTVDNSLVEGDLIPNLYSYSSTQWTGGGVICGLPAFGLVNLLSTVGSVIVLIILLLICLVIITRGRIVSSVQNGTRKVVDKTRANNERIRENRIRRREEYEEYLEEKQNTSSKNHKSQDSYELEVDVERDDKSEYRRPHKTKPEAVKKEKSTIKDRFNLGSVKEEPKEDFSHQNIQEIKLSPNAFNKPQIMEMQSALSAVMDHSNSLSDDSNSFAADITPVDLSEFRDDNSMHSISDNSSDYNDNVSSNSMNSTNIGGPVKPVIPKRSNSSNSGVNTHSFGMTEEYKDPEQREREERDRRIAQENAKKREALAAQGGTNPVSKYKLPTTNLLNRVASGTGTNEIELRQTARKLEEVLRNFGVAVKEIKNYSQGPAVTRFEIEPELGVKVSKIAALADDIKLNLAAADIRIEAPIPGKSAVGIEVPNKVTSPVGLRELLESDSYKNSESKLTFAVGKDLSGDTVVFDIAKMPHVLIAGSTGSGKSVCINTLIMSILFKARPDEVQLIMVDPKVVELKVYNGIPHLLCPVVTEPRKASAALQWAVAEMTDRYKKFADRNVRDLKGYNKALESEEPGARKLPHIVIIVDELADLMMVAGKEVEESIVRLAQLARAAGIHLVIATQRPSVNVITGLIKANMPSRVAFAVTNGIDSRTILDMNGAEKLLGKGDMLFYPQGYTKPSRVQGAFLSDEEVGKVIDYILNQHIENQAEPDTASRIEQGAGGSSEGAGSNGMSSDDGTSDELVIEAGRFIIEKEKASIGMLQRQFRIGFNRAARIMDELADLGVVGEEEGTKPRRILMTMDEFDESLGAR